MLTGDQLRIAREKAGLTQEALAQRVGVSMRSVGNWERGEGVPRSREQRVRDALQGYWPGESPSTRAADDLSSVSDARLLAEIARRFDRGREDVGIDDRSAATRQAPGSGADIHQLHEPGMPSPGAETTKAARAGTVTPNPLEGVGEEHQGEGPEGGA
jgi:transcriptional regulator with XRE-family HTH domain